MKMARFFIVLLVTMTFSKLTLAADAPQAGAKTAEVEATVKVLSVDASKRQMVVEGAAGNSWTVTVDPKVTNFDKIKKGDTISLKYTESLVWSMVKPGEKPEATKETIETSEVGTAKKKPERVETKQTNIVATIEKIDKKVPSVTLKGPDGNVMTFKVQYPQVLEGKKVGDKVNISYSESLAVAVEKK